MTTGYCFFDGLLGFNQQARPFRFSLLIQNKIIFYNRLILEFSFQLCR